MDNHNQNKHIYALNLTLETILTEERMMLLDSSFFSKKKSLPERTYEVKSYRQLDENDFVQEVRHLERNLDVAMRPKIFVLQETVEEMKEYQRIVSAKANFMNNYKNRTLDHQKILD